MTCLRISALPIIAELLLERHIFRIKLINLVYSRGQINVKMKMKMQFLIKEF